MCVYDRNSVIPDKSLTEFFISTILRSLKKNFIIGKVVYWPTELDLATLVSIWKSLTKFTKKFSLSCFPFSLYVSQKCMDTGL